MIQLSRNEVTRAGNGRRKRKIQARGITDSDLRTFKLDQLRLMEGGGRKTP